MMGLGLAMMLLLACSQGLPRDLTNGAETPADNGNGQAVGDALGARMDLLASSGFQRIQPSANGGNTGIWVNGSGEASGVPDLAVMNMGVEALAGTVAQARRQAADAMNDTIEALESMGIKRADIQTRNFSISPRYTRQEVTRCNGGTTDTDRTTQRSLPLVEPVAEATASAMASTTPTPPPIPKLFPVEPLLPQKDECYTQFEQVLLGFQVSNQLTVKVRDLDTVGDVIDRATGASGDLTRFNSIKFTIEDAKGLREQARAAAVKDLMAKAAQVAALAGVELGRLTYITESGGQGPLTFNNSLAVKAFAESAPTPILSGQMTVSVNVQGAFVILGSNP